MEQLIEALTIFLRYGNTDFPTHCEHDVLYVFPASGPISPEDEARLEELGFFPDEENPEANGWMSFRYGSC